MHAHARTHTCVCPVSSVAMLACMHTTHHTHTHTHTHTGVLHKRLPSRPSPLPSRCTRRWMKCWMKCRGTSMGIPERITLYVHISVSPSTLSLPPSPPPSLSSLSPPLLSLALARARAVSLSDEGIERRSESMAGRSRVPEADRSLGKGGPNVSAMTRVRAWHVSCLLSLRYLLHAAHVF